jgi:hypothetical protein
LKKERKKCKDRQKEIKKMHADIGKKILGIRKR